MVTLLRGFSFPIDLLISMKLLVGKRVVSRGYGCKKKENHFER